MKSSKTKWVRTVERHYSILAFSINGFALSTNYINRFLKIKNGKGGIIHLSTTNYWKEEQIKLVGQYQIDKHKKIGNQYLWEMAKLCEDEGNKLIDYCQNKVESNIKELSNEELTKDIKEIVQKSRDYAPFIIIPLSLETYLEEKLQVIKDKLSPKFFEYLETPKKMNESQKEAKKILKISLLSEDQTEKAIEEYIKEFGWIQVKNFFGKFPTIAEVNSRLKDKKEAEDKLEELKLTRKNNLKLKEELKEILSEEDFDTTELIKEYIYLRTFRTDNLNRAQSYLKKLLVEVALKLKIDVEKLFYFSAEEIIEMFTEKKFRTDLLEERKIKCMITIIDDQITIFSGEKEVNKEFEQLELSIDEKIDVKELKGKSAYPGIVKGIAKVVIDVRDLDKIQKGNIMVALMTFPSFIVGMEKAIAFVTDQGGLLSHASIVAREMKKPCIIGTKVATKVIKDGDLIEVNADKGIVKILN
jgi:phosphoenolpyruvate synthase/pyruvate phosphate dikinase